MSAPPTATQATDSRHRETYAITHRGVMARLADPYLTDHDRWVLGQFARFLSGRAPGPDPRAVRERPTRPLYPRARRSTL